MRIKSKEFKITKEEIDETDNRLINKRKSANGIYEINTTNLMLFNTLRQKGNQNINNLQSLNPKKYIKKRRAQHNIEKGLL